MPADEPAAPTFPEPFRPRPPVVIGLVGGVAAGKSTVAALFANHGLRHVDADQLARAVSETPAVLQQVAHELGPELVRDGRLDRAATAAFVFRDPSARQRLEAIVHPPVRAAIEAELAAARAAGESVLLDVPLLLENGLVERCDHVVFVAASDAVRAARAKARGWADGELNRREANQATLASKRARAEAVVHNDGDLAATSAQVAALLRRLASRSG